jgi:hypothetical protein
MRKFYIGHTEIVFGCEMDRDAVIKANSVKEAVAKLQQKLGKKFGMVTEMSDITAKDQDAHFYIETAEFASSKPKSYLEELGLSPDIANDIYAEMDDIQTA